MDGEFVTEVPNALKRLARMVMRGFYTIEHVIVVEMLIRNPCMKEDDLVELLKFERKQLRAVIAQLKNDRFVKMRLRMETGPDGKATRQNYYYINYKVFVNVVKYKLDHMRRKIETEERDSTSRASFRCTVCEKTFTDLEADQLIDFNTNEFRCTYCNEPVEEDESALPKKDSRMILAHFNEQIESLYMLLREVEDIKLAPELLEPEPTDVTQIKRDAGAKPRSSQPRGINELGHWSGEATRNRDYHLGMEQGITINFADDNSLSNATSNVQERKERPIWMVESTVLDTSISQGYAEPKLPVRDESPNIPQTPTLPGSQDNIMEALLAHEKKGVSGLQAIIPGQGSAEESDTSESEEEAKPQVTNTEGEIGEMERMYHGRWNISMMANY
ncbi:general transcription factor IIE subunit 1-like, partial [Limulus polyphemus]|uniref:General transcription factor IIE subunit 1-like n=1 Tax=Limulus polyphemus TaxID=6850 RepID=A0ABM1BFS4_LIMPO